MEELYGLNSQVKQLVVINHKLVPMEMLARQTHYLWETLVITQSNGQLKSSSKNVELSQVLELLWVKTEDQEALHMSSFQKVQQHKKE